MNKKILFLILALIIFITGCNANYTLIIDGDNYKDELYIYDKRDNILKLTDQKIDEMKTILLNINNIKPNYIITRNIESRDKIGYKYSGEGEINDFKENSIIKEFYEQVNVEYKNNVFLLKTSNQINLPDDFKGKITIDIKTNRKLIETNATKKTKNLYSWEFDTSKDINQMIYIKLGNKKTITAKTIILYIGIITLTSLITIFIVKRKKSNEV